jgi:hypothetical protein
MPRKSVLLSVVALALALAVFAGCNHAAPRTDAQVASDVQSKVYGDPAIQSRDIRVQANNGIVTLSGNVTTDAERGSAANDAATIAGVKTVVNDLQVQQAQVTPPPPPVAEQSAPAAAPVQRKPETKQSAGKRDTGSHSRRSVASNNNDRDRDEPVLARTAPSDSTAIAQQPTPVAAPAPPTPPLPPQKVTIPAGTQLTVRLNGSLDSERNQVGDVFHGSLGAPIVVDDQTVIPVGADVDGRVAAVQSAGRFAGASQLTLDLTSLSVNGKTYNIQTNEWSRQGKGEGKNTAVKAGGGAALGAIIGGLASGGRGAAIGAAAGGAAGTGVAATKKGEQIKLGPESALNFQLLNALTVTPQGINDRNSGRTPLDQ